MRTRRLCGLALVVLALHAIAWRLFADGLPSLAPARAGVHRLALVSVSARAQVPSRMPDIAPAPPAATPIPTPTPTQSPAPAPVRVTPAHRVPAGAGGTRRRAPPQPSPWPVYATRPPPSAALHYALVQGGAASAVEGVADLDWHRDADAFSLHLTAAVGDRPAREWQSTGTFDGAGVAPLRLVERERGRDRRSLDFDRAAGHVRFSGASGTRAVAAGAQDRWSWVAQLAAIAEASALRGRTPTQWDLQVAGLRGDLERWTFLVLPPGEPPPELRGPGNAVSSRTDRAPALLHVLRAPDQPYQLRIEAWLSPSLHHFPAGLRMSTPPGPWSMSLWQRDS
jgi:hypothetical protein